jgi:hypothetical protein
MGGPSPDAGRKVTSIRRGPVFVVRPSNAMGAASPGSAGSQTISAGSAVSRSTQPGGRRTRTSVSDFRVSVGCVSLYRYRPGAPASASTTNTPGSKSWACAGVVASDETNANTAATPGTATAGERAASDPFTV